ncbi:acyl carrier protein [Streptococcus danieliae]|uniref:Acyl carrier protein n=1 Tax=Streptococcus danieliae TaxID=747656 RepID=A0A7Z0LDA8_9STRE|nr:acyl carrier protein [Streptococcus danieliae]MBF0717434.1 acyl carrier protein [Streptococcus danieliae]MCU0081735.1 acyl carrier protein [Streptococcus danieliae]NYS32376.1 acyl carrier protein [Streptococcus danieliae]NYS49364.1 acyl carrier protein [Streptococcus danieliae]
MSTFEKIQAIIVEELEVQPDQVTLESSFNDLDVDSLDLFQVITAIEDEFSVEIDDEKNLTTIADLVAFVEQ